jgi:K(+)-stimulated pyrophosphate-energized sodium pump
MLIGGAVPFLFSSMTIRAVGRAAYLIVQECRTQFRDREIWAGTKKPNYARVVGICTATAQKELVGPGLLAIFTPILVGFALGPYALGGYLAGMIVVGQLLAVFMANSGGAWDNAKKTIEDQPRTALTGKGSEVHKASVTGDTVGDPLKDTAGPAINPLIKVMNMVSLLALTLVIPYNLANGEKTFTLKDGKQVTGVVTTRTATECTINVRDPETKVVKQQVIAQSAIQSESRSQQALLIGLLVVVVSLLAIGWAWWQSKRETAEMRQMDEEFARAVQAEAAASQ